MIFNMAGYVIQETAETPSAEPDTAPAAEAEPPPEALAKARVLLCSTRAFVFIMQQTKCRITHS